MVIQPKQSITVAAFEAFAGRPENQDKTFEWINGEIIEVPSNPYVSKIAGNISGEIYIYLKSNDLGHLTGEAGGYIVGGERYAPDVAFISYERQPRLPNQGYNPNPPELVVEVISDPDNAEEQRTLRLKLSSYLASQVVVWIVNPKTRRVEIHRHGEPASEFDESGVLTVEDILPGFKLPVKDIFPPMEND